MSKASNKIYILSFFLFFLLRCFDINAANLSYEERIAGQKSIEAVYWKHRLWPAENKKSKPQFEEAVSPELIRSKVDDVLQKSAALESVWKRPLSASQLQAEMDRIVKETKDPRMLQEIFDALGNNPERIAECLARPILADRLIRNWYGYDQRFHGELRSKVEKELNGVSNLSLRNLSGEYQEMIWKRSDQKSPDSNVVSSSEWSDLVQKLGDVFQTPLRESQLPVNQISKLQENESEFYIMTILEKSGDAIKIGSMRWKKISFEKWWAESKSQFLPLSISSSFKYNLPVLDASGASCSLDTWSRTPSPPISERYQHSAVWTGSEMIIWGGNWGLIWNTGGKYNPATDSWIPTNTTGAPQARMQHTAVWTGTEMIVWGGQACVSGNNPCSLIVINTGGRYNPVTDTWLATSTSNGPSPSYNVLSAWTGTEMIIWGGYSGDKTPWRYSPAQDSWTAGSKVNAPNETTNLVGVWTGSELIAWGGTGGNPGPGKRYNPQTNQWKTISTINEPEWRFSAAAIWSGTEMILWGGWGNSGLVNTGGRYNPVTDSWNPTNVNNAPSARHAHTAVWTGSEMIAWGGVNFTGLFNDGARYDPSTDSWISLGLTNAPSKRASHTAIWTETEMIIFGGNGNTGGRYDPLSDSWVATNPSNLPRGRLLHTAIWTGTEMIVWGGRDQTYAFNSGGLYDPTTNSWTLINDVDSVQTRSDHTAIWTGNVMIVWGGKNEKDGSLNSGARFNPLTMEWNPTSNVNVPEDRYAHTAVWTGSEMIVWGGMKCLNPSCISKPVLQTGGQYDPISDQWVSTSMTNPPSKREEHSAIWTGTEMIVWGGRGPLNTPLLNDGSRYDPASQVWTPISSVNAPSIRMNTTAVWTGTDMIVWGGTDLNNELDTGGIYNPSSDTWIATSQTNAPAKRFLHKGIWTDSDFVVWGGQFCDAPACVPLSTGGRYTTENDSWSAMSNVNSPPPSHSHTAVWTGTQMIVWGGQPYYSEGGLYCLNDSNTYLFFDDFEDGILDSNWTYKRTWNESNGALNGNGTAGKASAIASPVFAGCTTCITDFVVQSSGGLLSKVWMFAWYVDKKNTIELLMKEDKDKWILRDRLNGVVVSKFKVSQQILPNTIYNVRISYDGNQFQIFVNDFQNAIITFVPAHTISPGTIGLKVVNTDVSLQNISVY